jgi:RluA family pseudouridine synthase
MRPPRRPASADSARPPAPRKKRDDDAPRPESKGRSRPENARSRPDTPRRGRSSPSPEGRSRPETPRSRPEGRFPTRGEGRRDDRPPRAEAEREERQDDRPPRRARDTPRRADADHPEPKPATAGRRAITGIRKPRPEKGSVWTPGPGARTIKTEAGTDLAHVLVTFSKNELSVRAARKLIEAGNCRINGRIEAFHSYEVQRGDVVEFFVPEDREHRFDKRRVLHEESGLIAYDKPPYLAVTPQDGPKSWSLFDILKAKYPDIIPVHRLDADTSGIVLFARNPTVAAQLEKLFKDHQVQKTYTALVRGHIRETGTHKSYLVKVESGKGFEKWKSGRGQDAREAITTWKVLEQVGKYGSLVKVEPKTGRYHQIRIHFSEMGHPLYGDRIYSDRRDPVHVDRHQLHATSVLLPNPCGGPILNLTCEIPADMVTAMERLRKL